MEYLDGIALFRELTGVIELKQSMAS